VSKLPTDIATKLLFENDRVRVWEARLEPGDEFPTHMHSYDYVQVMIEGDKVAATIDPASGGTWEGHDYIEAEVTNGLTIWAEKGSAHNTVNVGKKTFYEILVEIKD
jgi:quercetin dioxygenase-like cupin family protein